MKKIIIFPVLFVVCTSFNSCQDLNRSIMRNNSIIPDTLYSFFPQNDTLFDGLHLKTITGTPKSSIQDSLCMFATYFLAEYYSCKDSSRKYNLLEYYRNTAIRSFNAVDNEKYFIIGDEYDLQIKYDTSFLRKSYERIPDCSFLLPDFSAFEPEIKFSYDTSNLCSLPDTYEIFVIKAGICDVGVKKNEWNLLPAKIKHGYISGVAIDIKRPIIIYWSVMW